MAPVTSSALRLDGELALPGDHRMPTAFDVLGSLPGNEIAVDDRACVGISYSALWRELSLVTGS
jgi:3-phosphoshikimate 1-carboxyvinyltransferase